MNLPNKKYDVIMMDPPWYYHGDPNKMAAAGKHYSLMSQEDICTLPIRDLLKKQGAVFCWATCPRLDFAIEAIQEWGLHYRGVAFVWVKTRKDGGIIGAQGVPPTFTKPTTELLLAASTCKKGRPFPIQSSAIAQVVLAPREAHSQKPEVFRERIIELCGNLEYLEMFARRKPTLQGWDFWGNEV